MTVHAASMNSEPGDSPADAHREEELSDAGLKRLLPLLAEDENAMKTVRMLRDLQKQHDTIFEEYIKAKQELEERYERRFSPLFVSRRSELERGHLPDFWSRCFENCELLASNLTEKDAFAFSYLEDVSCETVTAEAASNGRGLNAGSFVLRFRFRENPFFSNGELVKTYAMGPEAFDDFPEARGCEIHWKAGKNLTVKTMRKKAKNGRVLVKTQPTDSFFNFFSPPNAGADDDEVNSDIENVVEADVELGEAIRNDVIPRALYYYLDMEDDDDDEDEDDDDDDGDDDDDDSEAEEEKGKKKQNGTDKSA